MDRLVSPQDLLGYLNYSEGRPDPRFQKGISDAYHDFDQRGVDRPWQAIHALLRDTLAAVRGRSEAFRQVAQAEAVLSLVFDRVLPAYRAHHEDLLFHLSDRALYQPFWLARAVEAVLAQGPPWTETDRIVRGSLDQLNDFIGHRPVAVLETRQKIEPYDHERVRPIPLYLRGAGVAWGPYHDLVATALRILADADPEVRRQASFDLELLDELAVDPRAFDHGHPVNDRPNYVFGEWDPHHLDNQGRYRRYVARQITLDALLERVEQPGAIPRDEAVFEAAAVLAGTILMASGISGRGPDAHDSSTTLARLVPPIARNRDAFYAGLLAALDGPYAARLRHEAELTRQPFGGARQHLNRSIARHRAAQLQHRRLAHAFAAMGYPEASRRHAARIPAASVRMLSEIHLRITTAHRSLDHGALADAARLMPEITGLLHRGIACGAIVDPWNILGFQGQFSIFPALENSVPDPRIDELLQTMERIFELEARLSSEAAARGEWRLGQDIAADLRRLAGWWDQFGSIEVSGVRRVHGQEAAASAAHVAAALAQWRERGDAAGDVRFWRDHVEGFTAPKAFALVIDALLGKDDFRAAMALLMQWLSQADQVPLEDGPHSFHTLAVRWLLSLAAPPSGLAASPAAWPLVKRFFDSLEANADDYWSVPALEFGRAAGDEEDAAEPAEDDDTYGAAYEGVTYRDTAADGHAGDLLEGGRLDRDFELESTAERLEPRLKFLATLATLWRIAAAHDWWPRAAGPESPEDPHGDRGGSAAAPATQPLAPDMADWNETLQLWRARGQALMKGLLSLMDAVFDAPIPQPLGSHDTLVAYDRRRSIQVHLLDTVISTYLNMSHAVRTIGGILAEPRAGGAIEAPWEPAAIGLEKALRRGDPAAARAALPEFVRRLQRQPLVHPPLEEGGHPRQVIGVRSCQAVLRSLLGGLPRLGLLRETYHLLSAVHSLERSQPADGPRVTGFGELFQTAYRAVIKRLVNAAATWESTGIDDEALVGLVETITEPFLTLWVEHGRTLKLSELETVAAAQDWHAVEGFIQTYGADLFGPKFMTLGNLRGILQQGAKAYLEYLKDEQDPLAPFRLVEDLGRRIAVDDAARTLTWILAAVVENYEEYLDYNSTTTQSDYGNNLFMFLEFLRLKMSYERYAWNLRPLVLAHAVLARKEKTEAAALLQESVAEGTQELADRHLQWLRQLEAATGMSLRTVADRIAERFVKAMALDRLCAWVEPAMEEARSGRAPRSLAGLERELEEFTAAPTGSGLSVPLWLRRLEVEVERVVAGSTAIGKLAERAEQRPEAGLSVEDVQRQVEDWDKPLESEAGGG